MIRDSDTVQWSDPATPVAQPNIIGGGAVESLPDGLAVRTNRHDLRIELGRGGGSSIAPTVADTFRAIPFEFVISGNPAMWDPNDPASIIFPVSGYWQVGAQFAPIAALRAGLGFIYTNPPSTGLSPDFGMSPVGGQGAREEVDPYWHRNMVIKLNAGDRLGVSYYTPTAALGPGDSVVALPGRYPRFWAQFHHPLNA